MEELTLEQTKAATTIAKLLALAEKAGTPEEAASATAKAQAMMVQWNLEAAVIGKATDGKREDLKTDGGFYEFQRALWRNLAELNFCLYFLEMYKSEAYRYVDIYTGAKSMQAGPDKERRKVVVWKYRHRLVGKVVNTRATINMGNYLQTAIERIFKEHVKGIDEEDAKGNYGNSFRYGAAWAIIDKIQKQRNQYLKAEKKKQEEAAKAGGRGDGTTLSLAVFIDQETDANNDFLYGEGWSAEKAKEAQEAAERARIRAEEYAKWAEANPEEARAREEEARKERRRYRGGGGRSKADNIDYGAFNRGQKAAASISLHQQTEHKSSPPAGKLSGPKAMHL